MSKCYTHLCITHRMYKTSPSVLLLVSLGDIYQPVHCFLGPLPHFTEKSSPQSEFSSSVFPVFVWAECLWQGYILLGLCFLIGTDTTEVRPASTLSLSFPQLNPCPINLNAPTLSITSVFYLSARQKMFYGDFWCILVHFSFSPVGACKKAFFH